MAPKRKSTKRSYGGKRRKAGGQRLPAAVSLIARVNAEKLKANKLKKDLEELGIDTATSGIDAMRNDPKYKPRRLIGRGRYTFGSFLRDAESIGARATRAIAPYTRRLADAGTDALIGWGQTKLMGRGAYGSNQLGESQYNDLFTAGDKDDIVLTHTEFLKSIEPTSSNFETQFSTVINPGLTSFAPMLAQIAQYYEEYEILQLVFSFKSTVVDGNDNAAGTVLMATQYNPTNPNFTDDVAMDNYAHSCVSKVTDDMHHGVECETFETGQGRTEYIRTGPVPTGQDAKTYDLAVFQLATKGAFANLQIGRLYATYKVRLSKLKLVPTIPLVGQIPYQSMNESGTSIADTSLFGVLGSANYEEWNIVGHELLIQNNTISFNSQWPKGKYLITILLRVQAAATIVKPTSPAVSGGITLADDGQSPTATWNNIFPENSQSSLRHCQIIAVNHSGINGNITFGYSGIVANANNTISVVVTQIDPSILLPNSIA